MQKAAVKCKTLHHSGCPLAGHCYILINDAEQQSTTIIELITRRSCGGAPFPAIVKQPLDERPRVFFCCYPDHRIRGNINGHCC